MSKLWYILAGWCVVLCILAAREKAGPPGGARALRVVREDLQLVSTELQKFRAEHGRYPSNDEGLSVFVKEPPEGAPRSWPSCRFTSDAFDEEYRMFPMPGGILGWAGVPLVYENRHGLPPETFADSPANDGGGKSWLLEVDEGVFVYSLPGRNLSARIRSARVSQLAVVVPLLAGAVLLILLGVWSGRREAARDKHRTAFHVKAVNWMLGIGLVLVGFVFGVEPCMVIACYPGTVLRMRRDEKAAAQYTRLLEDFHSRGVIREETFKKLVEASNNPDWDPMRF